MIPLQSKRTFARDGVVRSPQSQPAHYLSPFLFGKVNLPDHHACVSDGGGDVANYDHNCINQPNELPQVPGFEENKSFDPVDQLAPSVAAPDGTPLSSAFAEQGMVVNSALDRLMSDEVEEVPRQTGDKYVDPLMSLNPRAFRFLSVSAVPRASVAWA